MKNRTFGRLMIKNFLIVSIVLFIILFSVILYANITEVDRTIQETMDNSAELITSQFSYIVRNMEFISTHTLSNLEFVNAVSSLNMGTLSGYSEQQAYSTIQSSLINYSIVSSIYRVTFFNQAGYLATSESYNLPYSYYSRIDINSTDNMDWIDVVSSNHGESVLLPVGKQMFSENPKDAVMLVRAIRSGGGVIGYLIVDVAVDNIERTLNYNSEYVSSILIFDEAGDSLYQNGDFQQLQNYASRNLDNCYQAEFTDTSTGIYTVLLTPKSILWKSASGTLLSLLLEGVIVLGATSLIIIALSKRLTKPLTDFTTQLKNAEYDTLNLRNRTPNHGEYAEISYLYEALSSMQEKLHALVEKEITWNTLQVEQKLETLQTQINPHFLYNTLNIIGIMGSESNNSRVYEACRELSSLLRYSMSSKDGYISTLGREIENVGNYLALMKLRFEDSCVYEISSDPVIVDQELPRLSLQPLVENIFEHAYDNKHTIVKIVITTTHDDDNWYITVSDNGCGVTLDESATIKNDIDTYIRELKDGNFKNVHSSIGLKNTLSRIHLFFDGEFSYSIKSGTGFEISLVGKRR